MTDSHGRNLGLAVSSLLASSATLVCCVLPAVLVSLGAGAVLVGLVSAFPQLVWLSEHKLLVFGVAAGMLGFSGWTLWRSRGLPCPVNPEAARNCMRLRTIASRLYFTALVAFGVGGIFAFVLPLLNTAG